MDLVFKKKQGFWQELIFQFVLLVVVFIFYSFDRNQPHMQYFQFWFFMNYVLAAWIINYVLLPHFFYKKKYLPFIGFLILILLAVIFTEEFILERIYFPDTKGKYFPGFFYTLIDVLPVITILSGFKFAWDALKKQREVDTLKSEVRDSELQFLKSQINPHFLFNNLNNLYSYAIEQSPKTPEIILELSGLLRYMLYECKEQFVPLTKEIAQLENFVNLSEMQIENRGVVTFIKQNIHGQYTIAPLILIVFIENAFKHSTASQSDNIQIDIKLSLDDSGVLHFECTNSFQNQSNIADISNGIGLSNVKKRLEIIYPKSHTLNIEEKPDVYKVRLQIALSQMK